MQIQNSPGPAGAARPVSASSPAPAATPVATPVRTADARSYQVAALGNADLMTSAPTTPESIFGRLLRESRPEERATILDGGIDRLLARQRTEYTPRTDQDYVAILGRLAARRDMGALMLGTRLAQELGSTRNPELRAALLSYAASRPPELRTELLGALFQGPLDTALSQSFPLPVLSPAPRPQLALPERDRLPDYSRDAGPPPSPAVLREQARAHEARRQAQEARTRDLQQFDQGLRALQLGQAGHPNVNLGAVQSSLDRLIQTPHVRAQLRTRLRERLLGQLGQERAPQVAQAQAQHLLSPAFQERLQLEGDRGQAVLTQELARLDALDPELATRTSLTLISRTGLGQGLQQALQQATPEARARAIDEAVRNLPGGAQLSPEERSALGRLSDADLTSAIQGTGDVLGRLSQSSRAFLRGLNGPGALLTLAGAAHLAGSPGQLDATRLTQLTQAGLNVADTSQARSLFSALTGRAHQAGASAGVTLLGRASNGLGMFLNGRDAFNAFSAGDLPAGAAYAGATACCAGLVAAGLLNVWNPAGWVLLGLSAGAAGLSVAGAALRQTPDVDMLRANGWYQRPPPPPAQRLGR